MALSERLRERIRAFSASSPGGSFRRSAGRPSGRKRSGNASGAGRLFSLSRGPWGIGREHQRSPREPVPAVLVRNVVATRQDVHALGKQLAVAAWQRGFAAAPRKAFPGDGQEANRSVHR